jgi:hypothetical protein
MSDSKPEAKDFNALIEARDAALRVLADAHAHEAGTTEPDDSASARAELRHRARTSSGALLQKAAEQLGMDEIAKTLGVSSVALAHFLREDRTMTLAQQRTLALAVLLLCDGHDELRRRATALLGQVRAAAEFEAGVTQVHENPPPGIGWR